MNECIIKQCTRAAGNHLRGLCLPCYSKAKKLIDLGKTSWESLEAKGLALPKQEQIDPFTQAFEESDNASGQ